MSDALHYGVIVYGIFVILGAVVSQVRRKWSMQSSLIAILGGMVAIIAGVERSFSIMLLAIVIMSVWGFVQIPRSFGRSK